MELLAELGHSPGIELQVWFLDDGIRGLSSSDSASSNSKLIRRSIFMSGSAH